MSSSSDETAEVWKPFTDHTPPVRLRGDQPVMTTKGWDMIRELLAAAAIAGAAIAVAPAALADEGSDNLYFDRPGRYATDVPGMSYDAHLAGPCDNHELFTFGRGPGGEALQCRWIPNQWPPVTTGFWQISYELFGVQEIGSPCPKPQAAAQAPDGRPMLCLGAQGWQPGFYTREGFFPA
jgi:hypothetical protein